MRIICLVSNSQAFIKHITFMNVCIARKIAELEGRVRMKIREEPL